MIRSHLEYAQTVWSPYKQKHIEALESLQRRATKIMPCMKKLSYSDRLKKLALPTLSYRRLRGDIIETYKIVHGMYDVTASPALEFQNYVTNRGHQFKLYKKSCHTNTRLHYFTNRIVNTWNSLPDEIVNAPSISSLKNRLDKFWQTQDMVYNYKANTAAGTRILDTFYVNR